MNIHCHAFLFNAGRLSSIPFALALVMSRVEPVEKPEPREAERKPSQAEGDERDVDEALKRKEEKERRLSAGRSREFSTRARKMAALR